MLPKVNRVKKKKDFEVVFKKGAGFKNGFLILRIAKNSLNESRFGFVISQKVSKKAVVRNKIRRRLAETIRRELKSVKKGLDCVFVVLPGAEKKDYLETKSNLLFLLRKSKCLDQ